MTGAHRLPARAIAGGRAAIALLTIVPVGARRQPGGLGDAAGWFPLVGALVGGSGAAVELIAAHPLGRAVAAVLAVGTQVVLTGGLHQDALADAADALGARGDRARRLEVMRDPGIGAFGALALAFWVAAMIGAVAALPRDRVLGTLTVAAALARWSAVAHAAALPAAREQGLGAAFTPSAPGTAVATCVAAGMVAAAGVAVAGASVLLSLPVAGACTLATSVAAARGLGGRTGDTIGATVALTEVATCLALLAAAR
ncbi:MAG TPA: adenosylcobinamide-GDP ribazoletransferase [Solirubrobacteraceae bacterium]|nr:adenosylcobinamide-GDP ribazoletransferase [Solirubrobacteraceae bacterium]